MPLTEKQHVKAAELSTDVLKRRREIDAMQAAIEELQENLLMAHECKTKAVAEFQEQNAALNQLLAIE